MADAIEAIVTERKTAQQKAQSPLPLGPQGRPKEDGHKGANSTLLNRGSTSSEYLTSRIARDHPTILERMKAGEFRSVRAAAIEAGIVKPDTPLVLLNRAW